MTAGHGGGHGGGHTPAMAPVAHGNRFPRVRKWARRIGISALAGGLVYGGYEGYRLIHLGDENQLAQELDGQASDMAQGNFAALKINVDNHTVTVTDPGAAAENYVNEAAIAAGANHPDLIAYYQGVVACDSATLSNTLNVSDENRITADFAQAIKNPNDPNAIANAQDAASVCIGDLQKGKITIEVGNYVPPIPPLSPTS